MSGDDNDEQRLRELMRSTEQRTDPVPLEQFGVVRHDGVTHRRGALAAAAVLVLLVASGGLVVSRLGPRSESGGGGAHVAIGPSVPPSQENQLAEAAPCNRIMRDPHLASRAQLASFRPVAAVLCATGLRRYPGAGQWSVQIRRVATEGLAAATTALARSDQHSSKTHFCADVGYGPLQIMLVDKAGRYLHPRAPVDSCGAPQPAVVKALDGLRWRTVSVRRLVQTRTPASLRTGCDMEWKNELSYEGDVRTAPGPDEVFADAMSVPIRVCIYRAGEDILGGRFRRAVTMSGADAARLRSALSGGAPSGACHAQREFATVWAGHADVSVEFGGCWRVLRANGGATAIGTADPTVLRNLLDLP